MVRLVHKGMQANVLDGVDASVAFPASNGLEGVVLFCVMLTAMLPTFSDGMVKVQQLQR